MIAACTEKSYHSFSASRGWQLVAVGMLLLLNTGCVKETVDGDAHIFTYELWASLSLLLGGLVMAPAGWVLRQYSARLGWILVVAGLLGAIMLGPSMLRDRAVVDDTHFSLRTGIWGLTAVHDVPFSSLTCVRYTMEESRGRRGRKETNYYFVCERSDGPPSKVPLGSVVAQAAAKPFLAKVGALHIPTIDER